MPFMSAPFIPPTKQDLEPHPMQNEVNPNSMMMNGDEYKQQQYQPMEQSYSPSSQPELAYPQYLPPPPLSPNVFQPNYPLQQTYYPPQQQQPQHYQQSQNMMQASNQVQTYVHPTQYQQTPTQEHYSYQTQQQPQQQPSEPIIEDMMETTTKKPSKLSQISRRFQLSRIFTSVMPKSKKAKKRPPEYQFEDSRPPHHMMPPEENGSEIIDRPPPPPPTGPMLQDENAGQPQYDQMMMQESRYKPAVTRGNYAPKEAAGMQVRFGAGPMGGGSQVKVNPMAILKTLAFPMMKRPALNLNGKVVLGIVLENGAGGGHGPEVLQVPPYKRL
ncbi:hypothetical protein BLA29_005651 [Euroglyphus maynei]|uniref:Uncharacterized protein n=1 Tax=Euroglyphus maynei TaxID=6958 RepID=A0A1Y3API5_EURMA|nr:hypothetical protein BLA29_005651 [Euroglyphus maynei]